MRTPPAEPDAEKSILSTILNDPSCAHEIVLDLSPDDFYSGHHQKIMSAVCALLEDGQPADLILITAKLKEAGHLGNGLKASYLTKLMNEQPVSSSLKHHIALVRKAAAKRQIQTQGHEFLKLIDESADLATLDRKAAGISSLTKKALTEYFKPGAERDFKLVHVAEIECRIPDWLIGGMIEVDTLVQVFADPGSAKTFLGIDFAACVASGKDFHGRKTKKGPVVYIAGEGQNGIKRRFTAWSIRHSVDLTKTPLFISLVPASLCDHHQSQIVIDKIDKIANEHGAPVLVVIDTVARNFGPGDENSTRDMTSFIQAVDAIRAAHRSAVLLIHHSGHADKSRARGATALKGALDAEFRLDKDEQGVIRCVCTKMKDFSPPEPMAFRLRTVELGFTDEDGEPVTSAVLDPTPYEPRTSAGKVGRGSNQTVGLEVLCDLFERYRQSLVNGGFSPDTARVTIDDWKNGCVPEKMTRQAFAKIKKSLQEAGLIKIENGFVTITGFSTGARTVPVPLKRGGYGTVRPA